MDASPHTLSRLLIAFVLSVGPVVLTAQALSVEQFHTPPEAAKPRVWWHWMSGNVTKEGITADLEWMHRVGIGGMQMFDGDLGVPQYLPRPVIWMTPEWKAAFNHAGAEADRLGLEMAMAASGGWSETAGPWVKPEAAMKKVVWSETHITGPGPVAQPLPMPPHTNGPFQSISLVDRPSSPIPGGAPGYPRAAQQEPSADATYYKDTVVLAYKTPAADRSLALPAPTLTTNDSAAKNLASLSDGDYSTTSEVGFVPDKTAWIEWTYPHPVSPRNLTLAFVQPGGSAVGPVLQGSLDWSNDGKTWHELEPVPDVREWVRAFSVRTFPLKPVRARLFRLILKQPVLTPAQLERGSKVPATVSLGEASLSGSPRIAFYEDKASFGTFVAGDDTATPVTAKNETISVAEVLNLTDKLRRDGTLDWQAPAGEWTILRMGYSLTGKKNHPATPAATGFEVDKLSAVHVADYINTYSSMVSRAVSPYYAKSFRYFLMDSWEAGQENWTDSMLDDFRQRRGYDATPWLPTLTGHIVGSSQQSDAFLFDFRRTIAELLADNHYKLAATLLARQNIGLYGEAMGIFMPTTGDGILNKGQITIPMGEFWTTPAGTADNPTRKADVMETASASHLYGKKIVAAESFTSNPETPGWGQTPLYLKQIADENFARGVNRIVFHTSDQQPFVDDKHKPGITLGYYGQHYTRNITWAEQAIAWNTYLARCSYMEQAGQPVVDLVYFYGEGAPVTVPYWKRFSPEAPKSLSMDYINSDALLHRASVKANTLQIEGGMQYRLLVIPDEFTRLTNEVLQKVASLVKDGAVVVAPPTTGSPSLADDQDLASMKALAGEMWGPAAGPKGSHPYGKGKVYWGMTIAEVMAAENLAADLTYDTPQKVVPYDYPAMLTEDEVVWNHRRDGDRDVYFVANQRMRTEELTVHLRTVAKGAELWNPETGMVEPADYVVDAKGTTAHLRLGPQQATFVVLGNATLPAGRPPESTATLAAVSGPWTLSFPPKWGAPAQVKMGTLASWTASSDPGIKYFSGTATYSTTFIFNDAQLSSGKRILLNLGRVREFAEVTLNGKKLDQILWKPPFQIDVTDAIQPGENRLQVAVTNLWPNRIIGDRQPGAQQTYTFTVYGAYKADSPLTESGLIGPVVLRAVPAVSAASTAAGGGGR